MIIVRNNFLQAGPGVRLTGCQDGTLGRLNCALQKNALLSVISRIVPTCIAHRYYRSDKPIHTVEYCKEWFKLDWVILVPWPQPGPGSKGKTSTDRRVQASTSTSTDRSTNTDRSTSTSTDRRVQGSGDTEVLDPKWTVNAFLTGAGSQQNQKR